MLFSLLLACTTSTDLDTGKAPKDSGADSGTGDSADPDAPYVLTASDMCDTNTDDQPIWFISVEGNDPQGVDTLGIGTVETYAADPSGGGSAIDSQPLACNPQGSCTASWEGNDHETCDLVGRMWVRVILKDDDGNESAPYDFQTS